MEATLLSDLRSHFGFDSFRPGQIEAVNNLLGGRHVLSVMPTGSGKSLIYQLTAIRLPGQTLVLSPLIALMKDQVDRLNSLDITATYINSTLSSQEQNRRLENMVRGGYRLVYVAPERLRDDRFRQALGRVKVSLLAVDEAHCISQWGHDFRPDYLQIAGARKRMNDVLTVALTATATPEVQEDIVSNLELSSVECIVTGFNRPNLNFEVRYAPGPEPKLQTLWQLLKDMESGAAIVYAGTRREAEEVTQFIRSVTGLEASFYHAGLDAASRAKVQNAFISKDLSIVVATNAFGMGIDRADVRLVAHFNMPGTLEAYYQEAGRAGRDGRAAHAVLLYSPDDRSLQEWFIANDAPTLEEVRALYDMLKTMASPSVRVSLDELSLYSGLMQTKLRVGLDQLEKADVVRRLGDEAGRMLLNVGKWNEKALRAASAQVEERRQHKKEQLERMVAYAESNSCRRRILLAHFGDRGSAEAEVCCDNCVARRTVSTPASANDVEKLTQSERAALIILDAVRRLKWDIGRSTLAKLLAGSKAKAIWRGGYDKHIYYGRLAVFQRQEITNMIDQLISQGYFKVIGGSLPVLRLTSQGEAAVKSRKAISLNLPRDFTSADVKLKKAETKAGGTVELTNQLFSSGLSPAEIARQRRLTERTIYGHLAQLIGSGKVSLVDVVDPEITGQIRAAIESLQDTLSLSRIKSELPEHISYEEIRCVLADWNLNSSSADSCSIPEEHNYVDRIVKLGNMSSSENVDELIAALEHPNGNVRRLAASALGKIKDQKAVQPLLNLLAVEEKPQVRQYAVKALGVIGDMRARSLLEKIRHDDMEKDYTRISAKNALAQLSRRPEEGDSISEFLRASHPRELPGSWDTGWALDFNSRFVGANWSRTEVGDLVYRFKYRQDNAALQPLLDRVAGLCRSYPDFERVDALVAVPPSQKRAFNPVAELAKALSDQLDCPLYDTVLVKTRQTRPQKDMNTMAQKRANVAGAFAVRGDIRGKRLLVVDDLFDSGATLEEVCRVLRQAGASKLHVLTLTCTIHTDR